MGAAEVIAFAEVRARKQWRTLRPQLHARFDQWLDTLEQAWPEPPAALSAVTATGWDVRPQRTGGITATIGAHAHAGERQRKQASGRRCARGLKGQAHVWRTVETMGGPLALERPAFSCRSCRVGLSPRADALGVGPGWKQRDRQPAAAQWGTAVPDDTAPSLFDALTGRHCGSERRHTVPNHVGAGLTGLAVAPSRQAIARRIAAVSAGRCRRPVLVLGMDGASVPTRPESARVPGAGRRGKRAQRTRWRGQGRDAKGCRCSLLDGARIVPGRRGQQGHNAAHRGAALQHVTEAGVMPDEQVRLGVVCDGAEWRGQHVQALCPQARQVLDDSHCAPDLHRVAKAPYGASVQAVEWVEATMTRLSLGTGGRVLGGLRHRQAQSDEAAKAIAHCWDDLHEHRGRTADQKLRRGGYPLGSGGLESSNKFIGHGRLKRSGAWWYAVNSKHMFALRCAKYHGTLDQVFVHYQQRLRETSE